jgi:hypothetical protein
MLVIKNALRFGFVHSIGAIFMFLGRLFIICSNALVCYVMLTKWPKYANLVDTPYFPCVVAGFIGYLVGAIYMSIFSFAADTIFQCFLLDEELGANAQGRPSGNRPPLMSDFIDNVDGKKKCCGCC